MVIEPSTLTENRLAQKRRFEDEPRAVTGPERTRACRVQTKPKPAAGLQTRAHDRTRTTKRTRASPQPSEPDAPHNLVNGAHERTQAAATQRTRDLRIAWSLRPTRRRTSRASPRSSGNHAGRRTNEPGWV